MIKHIQLFTVFLFCCTISINAQNIEVQSFTYESTTRDSMIEFPNVDHNNYEKIWMYYSMRCKDGLVSTGTNTNRGCGEWDYSCNTSIIDSTRTDSLYTVSPSSVISGFEGDVFEYTTLPTYSYYQSTQYQTTGDLVLSNEYTVGTGMIPNEGVLKGEATVKAHYLYSASELLDANIQAGAITGMNLNIESDAGMYKNFSIRIKESNKDALSKDDIDENGFQEVYFSDTEITTGIASFLFHEAFDWDGVTSLLVEIQYDSSEGNSVNITSSEQENTASLFLDGTEDQHIEIQGSGVVHIEEPFNEISSEITISLWQKGDDVMPLNTTIFEGRDQNNQRQVNVHLPWSNGQVYWDCGNIGGYDRINKQANASDFKNEWNHWAFTKNTATGSMKIYLNGNLWHSGTGKTKPIDLQELNIGGGIVSSVPYFGKIDEFRVWNKELSSTEIKNWMNQTVTNQHPSYEHLMAYYQLNDAGTTVIDASPNNRNGSIDGPILYRSYESDELTTNAVESTLTPNITFTQNTYDNFMVTPVTKLDSLINIPNQVQNFRVEGTDLVLDNTLFLYQSGDMPIYDETGTIFSSINVSANGSIVIEDLIHYQKFPSKIELLSFVTPYGIGLDLGEGITYLFDVTDFGPILKGKKRLIMDRGGQWQEDIDIKFVYVEGTPSRDVIDMQQVWRVTSENYATINSDTRFEPVDVSLSPNARMYKVKAAITGHGQEGEFIPRNHYLNINGGAKEAEWSVWKECADNPVYPQGGTWIYDRAGWCPGMATDVQELDITDMVTPGESANIDYGMDVASGDSRYIVNVQMVSYGTPNFSEDVELVEIITPSNKIEHDRLNPICGSPRILIRNNGSTPLTSAEISYGINNEITDFYTWEGNLNYLETAEVVLPNLSVTKMTTEEAIFEVSVYNPNGSTDEYSNNNTQSTPFKVVPNRKEGVVIQLRTNNAPLETSWTLTDIDGNVVASRGGFLSANAIYIDTIQDLHGCYRLYVEDSDDDGISFWANNDGNGSVAISNFTSLPVNAFDAIATDFGRSVTYEFTAGDIAVSTDNIVDNRLFEVYPNPSYGHFQVKLGGFKGEISMNLYNQLGQQILTKPITEAFQINQTNLDLSDFDNGIYYLEVIDKRQILSKKLVKLNE